MDRIDLRKVKRYSIKKRYSKVDAGSAARPEKFGKTKDFFGVFSVLRNTVWYLFIS